MEQINWCLNQKKGIKLIDINEDIVNSYIKKSEESLYMLSKATPSWKFICSYYACYDILYALLQKCGIKSEIHECSIALMFLFENFEKKDIDYIKKLKKNRIYAQYYVSKNYDNIDMDSVKQFVLKIKKIINNINDTQVSNIRNKIKNSE